MLALVQSCTQGLTEGHADAKEGEGQPGCFLRAVTRFGIKTGHCWRDKTPAKQNQANNPTSAVSQGEVVGVW